MGKTNGGGMVDEILALVRAYLGGSACSNDLMTWAAERSLDIEASNDPTLQEISGTVLSGLIVRDEGLITEQDFQQEIRVLLGKYPVHVRGGKVVKAG